MALMADATGALHIRSDTSLETMEALCLLFSLGLLLLCLCSYLKPVHDLRALWS